MVQHDSRRRAASTAAASTAAASTAAARRAGKRMKPADLVRVTSVILNPSLMTTQVILT